MSQIANSYIRIYNNMHVCLNNSFTNSVCPHGWGVFVVQNYLFSRIHTLFVKRSLDFVVNTCAKSFFADMIQINNKIEKNHTELKKLSIIIPVIYKYLFRKRSL